MLCIQEDAARRAADFAAKPDEYTSELKNTVAYSVAIDAALTAVPREVTDAATAKRDAASCAYKEVIAAASPVYKAAVEEYERAETDLSEVAEIAAIEAVRETLSDSDKICFDERVQTMKDNKESQERDIKFYAEKKLEKKEAKEARAANRTLVKAVVEKRFK